MVKSLALMGGAQRGVMEALTGRLLLFSHKLYSTDILRYGFGLTDDPFCNAGAGVKYLISHPSLTETDMESLQVATTLQWSHANISTSVTCD